jgi:hypothetical protein
MAEPASKSDLNDLEVEVDELRRRVEDLASRPDEMFGRNFRIGMFLLGLAFVAVAGHWIIAAVGYFALKDAIFRND